MTALRDKLAVKLSGAGYGVFVAAWTGESKGIDDAINAQEAIRVDPYPLKRESGQLERLPAGAVPSPGLRVPRPLPEVHRLHAQAFEDVLDRAEPEFVLVSSPPGTGKTETFARVLAGRWGSGDPPVVARTAGKGTRPLRVLYLAPTKELAVAFVEATGGLAVLQEGRNPDPAHEWGCHRPDAVHAVGARRHNPAVDVCLSCQEQHRARHGGAWACNFLAMKEAVASRPIVASTLASFFHGGSDLRNYDVVVVDEALVPALTETVVLAGKDVAEWRARMDRIAATRHRERQEGHGGRRDGLVAPDARRDRSSLRHGALRRRRPAPSLGRSPRPRDRPRGDG